MENVERPVLAVDAVVIATSRVLFTTHVLFIKRKYDPFKDTWAFPGGHVDKGERLEDAVSRELEEETGLKIAPEKFNQVGAFAEPDRDPRGRTVSVAFRTFIEYTDELPKVEGADDAKEARWIQYPLVDDVELAFDHRLILTLST